MVASRQYDPLLHLFLICTICSWAVKQEGVATMTRHTMNTSNIINYCSSFGPGASTVYLLFELIEVSVK